MVYILEDDNSILELLLYALKSQNIEAMGFDNKPDFDKAMQDNLPNILILDIMLPNSNGFEILKQLKTNAKTKHITILLLSALNNEIEKVKGLDLGADDYITKPFGMMEFLARIRVLLRRNDEQNPIKTLEYDGLEYLALEHEVRLHGKNIKLTLKEFELLGFLLENPNRAFNRDTLLEMLWGYGYEGETRTLDMHIKTLRKKLDKWGKKIQTIHGIGYKLNIWLAYFIII